MRNTLWHLSQLYTAYLLTGPPQQSELLAEDLQNQGFNAKAFHAGMQTKIKTKLQDEFMAEDGMIVRILSITPV
jgi:superfamily II DNA helicase RecQ